VNRFISLYIEDHQQVVLSDQIKRPLRVNQINCRHFEPIIDYLGHVRFGLMGVNSTDSELNRKKKCSRF